MVYAAATVGMSVLQANLDLLGTCPDKTGSAMNYVYAYTFECTQSDVLDIINVCSCCWTATARRSTFSVHSP